MLLWATFVVSKVSAEVVINNEVEADLTQLLASVCFSPFRLISYFGKRSPLLRGLRCFLCIQVPELEFEIPPESQRGTLSTVS